MSTDIHWYALKVFYRNVLKLRADLTRVGIEYYYPVQPDGKPYVQSLLFVHCSEAGLEALRKQAPAGGGFVVYTHTEKRKRLSSEETYDCLVPAPIDEQEMAVFILVTSASPNTYEILGPDDPKYHTGQLVRVKAGPFEGLEGRVRRIKKDRRLVVTISGVVAVATIHIDPRLLEPVEAHTTAA
ncbi:MAG: KOW motif-containing protein [Bacteroidales bacterium]|nr:KOW motif-containing protein [Bacteroidales bacterium]